MNMISPEGVFTLFYLLVCFGVVYPPTEFISAGFTIQNLFSSYLESESERFIRYHMRKATINIVVYCFLPFIYILLLIFLGYADNIVTLFVDTNFLWKSFALFSITLPGLAFFVTKAWTDDNFAGHPIVQNLGNFCNNNNTWEAVAADIENEFRRVDKVCISTNPMSKVVVTENWIMKVTPLTIFLTHQSDATLVIKEATNYEMSQINSSEPQYLNIEVKSSRVESFFIRISSADLKDLEDRLARSINVLPEVKFHKTVVEQFTEVFKDTINKNPKYVTNMELEQCIGCLQTPPNVKIQKQCQDANGSDTNCSSCFCRPMWCADCLAKWFVSKQDPDQKNQWLASKCTCPMCRATFCVLDISLLSIAGNNGNN